MSPPIRSAQGYLALGESLSVFSAIGIFLTMIGVFIVSIETSNRLKTTESEEEDDQHDETKYNDGDDKGDDRGNQKHLRMGFICAVANVIFDVFGSFLTRLFGDEMNTFGINSVRFGSAAIMLNLGIVCVRCLTLIDDKPPEWVLYPSAPTMSRRDYLFVTLGVLFVTVACPVRCSPATFSSRLRLRTHDLTTHACR